LAQITDKTTESMLSCCAVLSAGLSSKNVMPAAGSPVHDGSAARER
jgi:hypothetical protein